jgi:hypothetical protein
MLTKYDELLCHQTVSTFDHPVTSAREWTERTWFSVHDTEGKCSLVHSFGYYPNRNIIDAYVSVTLEGKTLHAVRASRELRPRIDDVTVGPFSYGIVEPLKKVRSTLADNEYGVSYDILFDGAMPPHEEHPQFSRFRGRVEENILRYMQVGRPTGLLTVAGKTYQIDPAAWRTERDHSWGIRRGGGVPEVGVQPGEIPEGYLHNFVALQFETWGATYHTRENWEGKTLIFSGAVFYPYGAGREELPLTAVEHNYKFRSDIRQIASGEMSLFAADGSKREISARALSPCYLKAGGMFGYRDFTHGLWMGPSFLDGFTLDLTKPEVLHDVSFIDDVSCELSCDGERGFGIVELVVIGKYPKYGYEGY